ncbi:MAG TPA: HAMP domain-containing sensor histidine kinase, partial [Vicinamibacterales bacterium]|nr:HAMP domain-containing sensor histidine kinase [Vicinamibacterales bacterium]
ATDAIPLRRETADIRDLFRWALDVLRGQAATFDVGLDVRVDDDVPTAVSVDARKVAWAITSLVGNALRYVRRGSKTMPGGTIVVHVSRELGQVVIAVQDDGPGIPSERLQMLFNPSPPTSTVALGLAMVKDVVEAHGGSFAIESDTRAPSHGTTVRLTLPVAA